jgi:hypothetical protein
MGEVQMTTHAAGGLQLPLQAYCISTSLASTFVARPVGGGWQGCKSSLPPSHQVGVCTGISSRLSYFRISEAQLETLLSLPPLVVRHAAMATGIEIAGLVLAILPLCITAVEHHSDALSPFVTIVRHRREHRRRLQDLGVCLVLLEETIKGVLEASGIVGGIDVASFSDACVSQLWRDKGEESRIIAHFGTKIYKYSFVVTIDRIREDLVEIQSILGLPSGGSTAGANSVSYHLEGMLTGHGLTRSFTDNVVKSRGGLREAQQLQRAPNRATINQLPLYRKNKIRIQEWFDRQIPEETERAHA